MYYLDNYYQHAEKIQRDSKGGQYSSAINGPQPDNMLKTLKQWNEEYRILGLTQVASFTKGPKIIWQEPKYKTRDLQNNILGWEVFIQDIFHFIFKRNSLISHWGYRPLVRLKTNWSYQEYTLFD